MFRIVTLAVRVSFVEFSYSIIIITVQANVTPNLFLGSLVRSLEKVWRLTLVRIIRNEDSIPRIVWRARAIHFKKKVPWIALGEIRRFLAKNIYTSSPPQTVCHILYHYSIRRINRKEWFPSGFDSLTPYYARLAGPWITVPIIQD